MNNLKRRLMLDAGAEYHIYVGTNFNGFVKPHSHTFHQILMVTEGHVLQKQNGFEYQQMPGDVFITPAGTEHSLFVFGLSTSYYCLSLTKDIVDSAFFSFPDLNRSFLDLPTMFTPDAATYELMTGIMQSLMRTDALHPQRDRQAGLYLATAALTSLIIPIFENHEEEHDNFTDKAAAGIRASMQYIDANFAQPITVAELAKMSGISTSSFCSLFPKLAGVTVKHYITEKRIHEAIRLCYYSDLSFGRIALEVGYKDFSTFYRNFIKVTGLTPTEYRARAMTVSATESQQK